MGEIPRFISFVGWCTDLVIIICNIIHVLLSTFTWSSFCRRFRPSADNIKLSSTSPDDSLALTHRTFISATTKKSSWLKSSIAIKEVVANTPRFSSLLHNGNSVISHGGIPIGAVQLGSKHIQKFSNLINETLTKTCKQSLCYRGAEYNPTLVLVILQPIKKKGVTYY